MWSDFSREGILRILDSIRLQTSSSFVIKSLPLKFQQSLTNWFLLVQFGILNSFAQFWSMPLPGRLKEGTCGKIFPYYIILILLLGASQKTSTLYQVSMNIEETSYLQKHFLGFFQLDRPKQPCRPGEHISFIHIDSPLEAELVKQRSIIIIKLEDHYYRYRGFVLLTLCDEESL